MDIITKARELGEMLADSAEMKALKRAEADMEQDSKASSLFDEYKKLQIELVRATKQKKQPDEISKLKEELLSKQREINGYEITSHYLEAKAKFDSLIKTVNDVMIFAITGEEPCSSGNCSSCSGCK
jgi:cell fate (sporulation/competence/biofilm development) regulator YlbF (YheA/YmcA/DUF963 family)